MSMSERQIRTLVKTIGEAVGEELHRLEAQIQEDRKQIRELKDTVTVLKLKGNRNDR